MVFTIEANDAVPAIKMKVKDIPHSIALFRVYAEAKLVRDPGWLSKLQHAKHLACWCKLDKPCHADVLIELVKRTYGDET